MLAIQLQCTILGLLQLRGWQKQACREAASLPAEGPRGKPPLEQCRCQRERLSLPNHWALLTWPGNHAIRGNLSASLWRPLSPPPCPHRNAQSHTPGPARWPCQVPKKAGRNAWGQEKKCPQAQLIRHWARSCPFSLNSPVGFCVADTLGAHLGKYFYRIKSHVVINNELTQNACGFIPSCIITPKRPN